MMPLPDRQKCEDMSIRLDTALHADVLLKVQEAQLMLTNPRDAFKGQLRSSQRGSLCQLVEHTCQMLYWSR